MAGEAGEGRVTPLGAVVVCQVPGGRVFRGGWSSTALTRLICPTPGPRGWVGGGKGEGRESVYPGGGEARGRDAGKGRKGYCRC